MPVDSAPALVSPSPFSASVPASTFLTGVPGGLVAASSSLPPLFSFAEVAAATATAPSATSLRLMPLKIVRADSGFRLANGASFSISTCV